ncbi:Exostosin-3-like protein [Cladobotryum mycophilum]|uniref:Exostosin-3-like protein n=1 Tax=Cladobotryum mycophilum TaxID=491253 RepID=A0ABR0SJ35_9HYPO
MASCLGALQTRRFRRTITVLVALAFSVTTIVFLVNRFEPGSALSTIGRTKEPSSVVTSGAKLPLCSDIEGAGHNSTRPTTWREKADTKFADLLDDKFTIALSTFHRPKELKRTLNILLKNPRATPQNMAFPSATESPRDSLNEKLWPDSKYRTKAILLSDDDVFYRPEDLEFVFHMWRKFGKDRLTGALGRCASLTRNGEWNYNFCSQREHEDVYALILTNLAFTHISFLDYYFSDDPAVTKIRDYVDKTFNCEDIALNFVASMLTGSGPLLVRGRHQYVNLDPAGGISRQSGHMEARSKCLNVFADAFQCMPLMNETGRIEHGLKHNVWYKSLWDVIRG